MTRFQTIRIHCDNHDELSQMLNERHLCGQVVAILPTTKTSNHYLTFNVIIDTLGTR